MDIKLQIYEYIMYNIHYLPYEIIGIICNYLELDDLYEFVKLSKEIKEITYNRYETDHLIEIDNVYDGKYYNDLIKNVKFIITNADKLDDYKMKYLKNTIELNLGYNISLSNEGVMKLKKLEKLNLINNMSISDNAVYHLQNLKELRIGGLSRITTKCENKLVERGVNVTNVKFFQ